MVPPVVVAVVRLWSPPVQKAFSPAPASTMQPAAVVARLVERQMISSQVVPRKAFIFSGRLMVIQATPLRISWDVLEVHALAFPCRVRPWAGPLPLKQRGDGDEPSVATAIWSIRPAIAPARRCVAPALRRRRGQFPARVFEHDDVEQRQPRTFADGGSRRRRRKRRRDDARAHQLRQRLSQVDCADSPLLLRSRWPDMMCSSGRAAIRARQ